MATKGAESLTRAVINRYLGRKKPNYLSVIVDAKTLAVYPVPPDQEHIAFAAALLNIEEDDIKARPSRAQHLIPSLIVIKDFKVAGVVTGVSGMEIGFNVRHKRADLKLAHDRVWEFINKGELPIAEKLEENKIIYEYAAD